MFNKLHYSLSGRFNWYRNWHEHAGSGLAHWSVLVLVLTLISSTFATTLQNLESTDSQLAAVVASDNIHSIRNLNNEFLRLSKAYASASGEEDRAIILTDLVKLAEERKGSLYALMETRQGGVAPHLFPAGLVAKLPAEVQALLENEIDAQGTVTALYVDAINEADSYIDYSITTGAGNTYQLFFDEKLDKEIKNGSVAKVKGKALGNHLLLEDKGSRSIQIVSEPLQADIIGNKTLLAILVNFTDTTPPTSRENVYNQLFVNPDSTASLFAEGSYDKINLTGAATPWYTIAATAGPTCDTTKWRSLGDQAAQAGGYSLNNYNYVMYIFSGIPTSICNWGGQGYVPGTRSWINYAYAAHGSKAHELGHNFGAYHAGLQTCGGVQISNSCSFDQYGERNSKMGAANNYQFNGPHRLQFGWIPSSEFTQITQSGTYTLGSVYSADMSRSKVFKINKPDTNQAYYIAFREAKGFDASIPSGNTKGVSVYLMSGNSLADYTRLLVMTPGSTYTNTALWDGGTFTDSANGISVTQTSHTATTATLSITVGGGTSCSRANPNVSVSPASQTGSTGDSLTYNISVRNNDSSGCNSSNFTLSQTIPSGWSSSVNPSSINISPGNNGSAIFTVTSPNNATDASYGLSVRASNSSATSYTATAGATYLVYNAPTNTDTEAPTVVITSPITGINVNGNIIITANATDNVQVSKVEFYIDGKLVTTDTSAPYSTRWNTKGKSVSNGNHALSAKAYDSAGNIGTSNTVTVTK